MNSIPIEQLAEVGQEIYEKELRSELEKKHWGEYVAIHIETGNSFVAPTLEEALEQARKKYPNSYFHFVKIGTPARISLRDSQGILYGG